MHGSAFQRPLICENPLAVAAAARKTLNLGVSRSWTQDLFAGSGAVRAVHSAGRQAPVAAQRAARRTAACCPAQSPQQQGRTLDSTMPPRCIAVIECEDAEKWKDMTLELWRRILQRPGDEFVVFRAHAGDLPTPAQAAAFDALIIGGSHYSVYEEHAWIEQLKAAVPRYLEAGARLVGCCFGCQLLAEALGGRVGPNPSGRFVLGVERVTPSPEGLAAFPRFARAAAAALARQAKEDADLDAWQRAHAPVNDAAAASEDKRSQGAAAAAAAAAGEGSSPGADGSSSSGAGAVSNEKGKGAEEEEGGDAAPCGPCFRVIESHGDQVIELPPGAVALASSETAPFEMWGLGDNLLAFQFHIEFDGLIAMDKIHPALTGNGRLSTDESVTARKQLTSADERPETVAELVQHFIAHGLGGGGATDGGGGGGGSGLQQLRVSPRGTGGSTGPGSPTGASERSYPASIATASSAVPFSFLACQRRQQQQDELLSELTSNVVADAAAGFDARMRAALCDLDLLRGCGDAAAAEYERAGDVAAALANFAGSLAERQSAAAGALALAPQILEKLGGVQAAVAALEGSTKALERRVAALAREHAAAAKAAARAGAGAGSGSGSFSAATVAVAAATAPVAALAAAPAAAAATLTAGASAAVTGSAAAAAAAAGAVTSGLTTLVGGIGDGSAAAYKLVASLTSSGSGSGGGGGGAQGATAASDGVPPGRGLPGAAGGTS